jgi:enoyl-CoA hydratase/carnithine racemase
MSSVLRQERSGKILRLTLNDPQSRNSLSETMMAELHAALAAATEPVIIIAADGHVFCAGHNLKELTAHRNDVDKGEAYFNSIFSRCSELMMQITNHSSVIIAEVAGLASAAGCQLVATCDLAYASHDARFCTPGVNIGLFCSTPMTALSRNVSRKHGMEMLLTGDVYSAEYAHRVGLVNALVEADELSTHVMEIAEKISAKSSVAISYGKKLYNTQLSQPLNEAYESCARVMTENLLHAEAAEGIGAFLQKRKPTW